MYIYICQTWGNSNSKLVIVKIISFEVIVIVIGIFKIEIIVIEIVIERI